MFPVAYVSEGKKGSHTSFSLERLRLFMNRELWAKGCAQGPLAPLLYVYIKRTNIIRGKMLGKYSMSCM